MLHHPRGCVLDQLQHLLCRRLECHKTQGGAVIDTCARAVREVCLCGRVVGGAA